MDLGQKGGDMTVMPIAKTCVDVLETPKDQVPEMIRALIRKRAFSPLMQRINSRLRADDPALRARAQAALAHLGFPD